MGWGVMEQWFAAFSMEKFHVGTTPVTLWLAIAAGGWVFGGLVVNSLMLKWWKSYTVCLVGFIAMTVLAWVLSVCSIFWLFALLFALANAFAVVAMTNSLNLISISSTEDVQGKALGVSQSVSSFAWVLTTILAAFAGGCNILWLYPAACMLMTVGILILILSKLSC
jgi:predicted MFS family arabinose efflux permease